VYYVAQNNDPTEFAAMGFGVRVEGYEELPQAAE
jgi:hypothetical protein